VVYELGVQGARPPQKVLICQIFGQNLKKFGKEISTLKKNINEMILLCC